MSKHLTKEDFIKRLNEKYPNEPFEINEYNGTSKKGIYTCGICGQLYEYSRMGKLLADERKHLCKECFRQESIHTQECMNLIKEKENLEFIKFGYNKKLLKPTLIYKCLQCGQITEKPMVEFLKYPTCIHCGKNAKSRTTDTIAMLLPDGFEIISEYKNQYEKALFRHECGFIFKARPKDIVSGHTYCPKCSKKNSKGERKIIEYCNNNKIIFEKEKIFPWSNHKRYDFYLPQFNLIIEYMGIQHYKEVPHFQKTLQEQQEIDKYKQEIAEKEGINYLIISYWDFNKIEEILAQRLKMGYLSCEKQYDKDIV